MSNPEPDLLYYACDNEVYCLNTASKKRKLIASLPFEARCMASGYGWVCVSGGEYEGGFAAIKLEGVSALTRQEVDAALPIERARRVDAGRKAASVKGEKIGHEINSISIHRIQDEDLHLDDIVAVLASNEKSVRMYSLPLSQETRVVKLEVAVNHASISPDGRTLVAVGDTNKAFFYCRELLKDTPQIHTPHNRLTSASIEWRSTNRVKMDLPESTSNNLGYFTTAWSPSGRLVAVGSEAGHITVFDVSLLPSQDYEGGAQAIVALVPSSKPCLYDPGMNHTHPGAVRSMMFAPGPWDLLIWAEDQSRACIADLRTGLKTRQVIKLDLDDLSLRLEKWVDMPKEGVVTLAPADREPPGSLEQAREFGRVHRAAHDNVNLGAEHRGVRGPMRRGPSREHNPHRGFTASDEALLDSVRAVHQRGEAHEQDVLRASADGRARGDNFLDYLAGVGGSFPALLRTTESLARSASPHREVIHREVFTRPDEDWPGIMTTRAPRPEEFDDSDLDDDDQDDNPSVPIGTHMRSQAGVTGTGGGRGPLFEGAARAPAHTRMSNAELARDRAPGRQRLHLGPQRMGRQEGVRTTGLAISQDGRKMWVGCEEGIFEIDLRLKPRMFWGAVEMR